MQILVPKNTVLIIKWQNKKFSGWNWTFRFKYLILTDSHLHISINSIKSYIYTRAHTHTDTWEEGFSGGSVVKSLSANAGDVRLILGLGKSPGERNGYPLQYSCFKNPRDRRAWWAAVHGIAKWVGHDLVTQQQEYLWNRVRGGGVRWNLKHQGISKIFSGDFDVYPESAVMQFNHRLVLEFLLFFFQF